MRRGAGTEPKKAVREKAHATNDRTRWGKKEGTSSDGFSRMTRRRSVIDFSILMNDHNASFLSARSA